MKEKYLIYKLEYSKYILLFKCGNFYISLNKDAIVMNNIFNYKIKESTNFFKTGFPINSLNKVLMELENKNVNYLVINEKIINKQKYKKNNFDNYLKNYEVYLSRISNINVILKNNLNNELLDEILKKIESIVCKINC